eukprot:4175820-Pleurochrysis_carterae.AAC.4
MAAAQPNASAPMLKSLADCEALGADLVRLLQDIYIVSSVSVHLKASKTLARFATAQVKLSDDRRKAIC